MPEKIFLTLPEALGKKLDERIRKGQEMTPQEYIRKLLSRELGGE